MGSPSSQDKEKEVVLFDQFARDNEHYNVFTAASTATLVESCVRGAGWKEGAKVVDLGCGSGIFSRALADLGFSVTGVDLSSKQIDVARRDCTDVDFVVGDVECLPFEDGSYDGVLLSGLLHHLPDPSKCVDEVHRVLRPGVTFSAFDPNRRNPFMWLYRDKSSPCYSSAGETENERPILAEQLVGAFNDAGFDAASAYLSMAYQYVASSRARSVLPIYYAVDRILFLPRFM
jgi:ubiquinone/menaquinone biosynthesis C-methylase UbiE